MGFLLQRFPVILTAVFRGWCSVKGGVGLRCPENAPDQSFQLCYSLAQRCNCIPLHKFLLHYLRLLRFAAECLTWVAYEHQYRRCGANETNILSKLRKFFCNMRDMSATIDSVKEISDFPRLADIFGFLSQKQNSTSQQRVSVPPLLACTIGNISN